MFLTDIVRIIIETFGDHGINYQSPKTQSKIEIWINSVIKGQNKSILDRWGKEITIHDELTIELLDIEYQYFEKTISDQVKQMVEMCIQPKESKKD